MSENENVGIELGVDADAALTTLQELTAAALTADEAIQQLKQHQVDLSNAIPGNPQSSSYNEAAERFQQMDPALIRDTYPEITQTQNTLNARRTEVRAQAIDFVGANPQVAAQPLPDTLDQFQQAMAARAQQQTAQRERQAQQQAAGVERPARYGYEAAPVPAPPQPRTTPVPISSPPAPMQATGTPTMAPLAATGDERLAHALSAQTPTGTSAAGRGTGARDNDNAPMGDVLPAESRRSSPSAATGSAPIPPTDVVPRPTVGVPSGAPLATTGDERLAHALSAQTPTATPPTGRATTDTPPLASTGELPNDLQRLAVAAIAADEGIRRLQQHLVEQVNTDMGQAGIRPQTFEQAQDLLGRMPAADLAAAAPDVVTTQQRIAARSGELTGQVAAFGAQAGQATTGQPTSQLLDELKAFVQQQQQQAATGGASASPNGAAGSGAATSAVARYGLLPSTPPALTPGNDTTQTDRLATTMGERLASSMARAGVGMVTGGIQGAANAAGMGATGDLIAGLARPLMAMVSAPLAIGAAVIGGVAGVGLGVNALQSGYAGEERQLAGSVGTSMGATPEGELTTAQQAGWRYWYHEKDSVAAAQQLGNMGVTSDQMGGALTQSMALARLSGVGLDQTTALTGQMMQGGMSSNQVGQAYAEIDQVSKLVPVSLGRITEGIKAITSAAGVGQISLNGFAATQALSDTTGMKINIGQAMAGTIGSTGTNALAQGYMLGLDPAQFDAAQRDPAKLWDAYANTARRYDVGSGGSRIAQQALSEAGFDFSGMKGNQAETFIQKLVAEGPNAAQKYEQSLQQRENAPHAAGPHTADQFAAAGKAFADQVTPIGDRLKIAGEQAANALVRGAQDAAHALTPLEVRNQQQQQHDRRYGPSGVGTSHTTNVNPMQQLTQSTQGRGGLLPLPGSYMIPNGQGNSNRVLPYQMQWYEDAAKKYDPAGMDPNQFLGELLAQGSAESGFNANAVSRDKNGNPIAEGIAQFTPGTAHAMGLKDPFNPQQSIAAQARLDAALYQSHGHNEQQALAAYNGSGSQAQAYGAHVYSAAQQTQHLVAGIIKHTSSVPGDTANAHDQQGGWTGGARSQNVNVTVHATLDVRDQHGKPIPVTSQRTTHTPHSIDTSRKHVAAQSYAPDQRPPSPGLPNLPGHIK